MAAPLYGPGLALRNSMGMTTPEASTTSSHPPNTPHLLPPHFSQTPHPPSNFDSPSPQSEDNNSPNQTPRPPRVSHTPHFAHPSTSQASTSRLRTPHMPRQPKVERRSPVVSSIEMEMEMDDVSDMLSADGLPRDTSDAPSEVPHEQTGIQLMGRHVQMLQEVINNLEKLGVDKIDIPLPKLVVVGDQSAGKSSVIGGLAEIDLPRSSGTCTRCPYYIRTKGDSADGAVWSCRISIQKRFDFVVLPRRFPKRDYPLGPWRELPQTDEIHLTTTRNKDELHRLIVRAQKAVLNPSQEPATFLQQANGLFVPPSEQDEAPFSPNLVCLEISGPNLPSLSFYDLPGIIQTADEDHLVNLVETLAKKYINKKDAIILCALPMSGDPANSTAVRFIREAKALNRCIGVLTKPDLLQDGELKNVWEPILEGTKDGMRAAYGWYVTKQPGPNDAHLSHELARASETAFFDTQHPWCTELSPFKDRFGSDSLRNVVSETLTGQITKALPLIKSSIFAREDKIKDELARLPAPPPPDVFPNVMKLLSRFSEEVARNIDASASENKFQPMWGKLYVQFRKDVVGRYPRIGLAAGLPPSLASMGQSQSQSSLNSNSFNSRQMERNYPPSEPVEISDDDDDDLPPVPTPSKRRHANPAVANTHIPMKRVKAEERSSNGGSPRPQPSPSSSQHSGSSTGQKSFDLDYIREKIRNHRVTHIPGHTNPKVYEVLILESVDVWQQPLSVFVQRVAGLVRRLILELFSKILAVHRQTPLYGRCMDLLESLLKDLEADLKSTTDRLYRLHTKKAFTTNEDSFITNRAAEAKILSAFRQKLRTNRFLDREEQQTGKVTEGSAREEKAKKIDYRRVEEALGKDLYDDEMEVAAYVRGYYATAAVRFVDCVCLEINGDYFDQVREKVALYLETKLGLLAGQGPSICKTLMEPNADVARRRKALEFEQAQLHAASQNLERVVQDVVDGEGRSFLDIGQSDTTMDEESGSAAEEMYA